jgi:hypothetical protein
LNFFLGDLAMFRLAIILAVLFNFSTFAEGCMISSETETRNLRPATYASLDSCRDDADFFEGRSRKHGREFSTVIVKAKCRSIHKVIKELVQQINDPSHMGDKNSLRRALKIYRQQRDSVNNPGRYVLISSVSFYTTQGCYY